MGYFDVGGTVVGSGSLNVDDYAAVDAGTLLIYCFCFRCIRRLTLLIFVEVEAITKIYEPIFSRKRLPDASITRTTSEMYAFFPSRSQL